MRSCCPKIRGGQEKWIGYGEADTGEGNDKVNYSSDDDDSFLFDSDSDDEFDRFQRWYPCKITICERESKR